MSDDDIPPWLQLSQVWPSESSTTTTSNDLRPYASVETQSSKQFITSSSVTPFLSIDRFHGEPSQSLSSSSSLPSSFNTAYPHSSISSMSPLHKPIQPTYGMSNLQEFSPGHYNDAAHRQSDAHI